MNAKIHSRLPAPDPIRRACAAALFAGAAVFAAAAPVHAQTAHDIAVHEVPAAVSTHPGPLAKFHGKPVPDSVREVANWSFFTHDNQGRAVVILDKHDATVHVFDRDGNLVSSAPALLGLAVGDDTAPGVGDKPLSEVPVSERTTPAGRFVAQMGEDDTGTDVVWLDYESAVAMHRVIDTFPEQHRRERLRSPHAKDRRISYGCINLPIPFYEQVLSPTVRKEGAVIYVLPETRPPAEVFGSWDVTNPAARPPHAVKTSAAS